MTNNTAPKAEYLDCAVAVADGRLNPHVEDGECRITHGGENGPVVRFDEAWFCLQILPREAQRGLCYSEKKGGVYTAGYDNGGKLLNAQDGETPNEAMMRSFVMSKLGEWPAP